MGSSVKATLGDTLTAVPAVPVTSASRSNCSGRGADVRLTTSLKWFVAITAISTTAGTLLFCYRPLFGAAAGSVALVHEITGDAALVFLTVYLVSHLRRTWARRASRPVSWWSGIVVLACWVLAGATGVYGQFVELPASPVSWWIHAIGSLAAIVTACAHAAYGYRAARMRGS